MALPKQVEQEIAAIEALEKQMQAPATSEETPEVEQPSAVEPVAAEVEPTQVVEPVAPEVDWEHKYRTLAGKFDAEVPRLHAQVRELTEQIRSLQSTPPEPAKIQEPTGSRLVTDHDRESFGDDLIDLQRRVAQEVAGKYEQQIAALEQRLMQTGNQVGEMTFEQKLHRAVPDFEAINADPRWVAWLDEFSPELRGPRRTVAQQAYANGDIDGVLHYVNLFRAQTQPKKPDTRKSELERQVAPTRNAASGNAAAPQGKTYSYAGWQTALSQVDALVARGKYVEAQQLEAELTAAVQQGRVTQ
jgi:hypothetical protein